MQHLTFYVFSFLVSFFSKQVISIFGQSCFSSFIFFNLNSLVIKPFYNTLFQHLNLERNRIMDLRQCERYLPSQLSHLGLAHNNIQDLNEVSHLVHLSQLDSFTMQGNPCVAMAGKDKLYPLKNIN